MRWLPLPMSRCAPSPVAAIISRFSKSSERRLLQPPTDTRAWRTWADPALDCHRSNPAHHCGGRASKLLPYVRGTRDPAAAGFVLPAWPSFNRRALMRAHASPHA
ncbi:hypothetical protein MRX96_026915 [Rhipicephalus microplus]